MDASLETPKVYQFKIAMKYIKPPIWRMILVPANFTFAQLHIAIQCAMGWESAWSMYHLHQFEMKDCAELREEHLIKPIIDQSDYQMYDFLNLVDQEKVKICDYFKTPRDKADYTYDLGQSWQHIITLEKILPLDASVLYPICLGGRRAGPPEDCIEPEGYNPEKFDCKEVDFKPPEDWKVKNAAKKHKYGHF